MTDRELREADGSLNNDVLDPFPALSLYYTQ